MSDASGDSTPLPGGTSGTVAPLKKCAPASTTFSELVTECTTKCQNALSTYAQLINASLPPGTPPVQANQLTCNITNVTRAANDCPNTDPPGIPEPLFAGGPAQYVANLSGSVHVAVDTNSPVGTVSTDTGTSGQMGYAILPPDLNCPAQGCQLLVTNLLLDIGNFSLSASVLGVTLFDEHITNMSIQNVGWVTGTWLPNGHFVIPANTANAVVTLDDNGTHSSFDRLNDSDLTGTIDPATGAVSFDSFSQTEKDTSFTVNSLAGTNFRTPPVAVITLADTIECNRTNAAAVTLDGTASTPAGDVHLFGWSVNGGAPLSGATVAATLPLGADTIGLSIFNTSFGIGIAQKHVTVVDTTPPSIQPVAAVTDTVCDPGSQTAAITPPIATDVCSPTVVVTGAVVSLNGVTLGTPIPIQNGSVQLPPGVAVVRWTATDESGNSATTTQTLTVRPAIEASDSISLMEESQALLPNGAGFATLGNSGTHPVVLHAKAESGSILSQGQVDLQNRSVVHGSAQSARDIRTHGSVVITGTVVANTTVALPLGRDLSGVVFPGTNGGPVDVLRAQTLTLAPGAYSQVTVESGGILVLAAGTYFFETLDLEDGARINLDQSGGAVALLVHVSMDYEGLIASIAGSPGGFVLGYAGTEDLVIQGRFLAGTLIAPNAQVLLRSRDAAGFVGELFAKGIVLGERGTIVCDPIGLSAQQAGLASSSTKATLELGRADLAEPTDEPSSRPKSHGCTSAPGRSSGRASVWLIGAMVTAAAALRARKRQNR